MDATRRGPVETWIQGRGQSFVFAFRGLGRLYREPNARVHASVTLGVMATGLLLGLSLAEWTLVVVAATSVWACEALNTALELLADAAVPERNPLIGAAKDVAAGAVLIAAIGAALVGTLVFLPRLLALVR